jgi:glycogen debranching enzyme
VQYGLGILENHVVKTTTGHLENIMLEFAPILDLMNASCKSHNPTPSLPEDSHMNHKSRCLLLLLFLQWLAFVLPVCGQAPVTPASSELSISRPIRTWEFLPVVGTRAGIFGHENGTLEAWVYPMKLFRDFSLVFHVNGRHIPSAAAARTIEAFPDRVVLTYSGDEFTVNETIFVPRDLPGAVIELQAITYAPLEIKVQFQRDFQLMWPAAIGGTYGSWNADLKAFTFGEESKKWFGVLGSPSASDPVSDYETNYYANYLQSFRLDPIAKGTAQRLILLSGSVESAAEAQATYKRLATEYESLRQASAKDYTSYLNQTTSSLVLPDRDLQLAYDWARISVLQGVVANRFLGTGLLAGYRTSGTGSRPGFAWFFGRDSEWTTLALNSAGDFATTRTALEFLSKYQRQDGKVPHEISQAAKQVPWFTDFPYPWASADATPLYIIAVRDYYEHSGDKAFVESHWDNLWRAYQFLRSTWDDRGLPKNIGIGHGWVEGGPLLPVQTEFYQTGLGAEALNALATLAKATGKNDNAAELQRLFDQQRTQMNDLFWNPEGKFFAFALAEQNRRVDKPTVLTTVPMWFGVTDPAKADSTITQLADADHSTDWGMRILSSKDPFFDPSGYHFGSVWPLFTGWASVAEYRYHRPHPGYENLRANALLALNGSAGHATEVLSGAVFESLSTSSPHQIWSAAMIVSPILRGMLGIDPSTTTNVLAVRPHLPGGWTSWQARTVRMGSSTVDLAYTVVNDMATFNISARQPKGQTLEFAPSFSPIAKITNVTVNGKPAKFDVQKNSTDQHIVVRTPLTEGKTTISMRVQNDFSLIMEQQLPPLGSPSRNLKIVSESWTKDSVTYELSGLAGAEYEIGMRSPSLKLVEGATVTKNERGVALLIKIPQGEPGYRRVTVKIPFDFSR